MCIDVYLMCIYIGLSRLLELRKPEYDWGLGWGGMLTFMWTCGSSWCYAHAGWGGGVGWDVNVHVNLRQQLMLRTRGVGGGGVGWDINVHVNLRQQLMLRTRGVGGVGWGGMLTFMWTCGSSWCYAHAGWGGGVGWDVNVHVNLRQQLMLRTPGPGQYIYTHIYTEYIYRHFWYIYTYSTVFQLMYIHI